MFFKFYIVTFESPPNFANFIESLRSINAAYKNLAWQISYNVLKIIQTILVTFKIISKLNQNQRGFC